MVAKCEGARSWEWERGVEVTRAAVARLYFSGTTVDLGLVGGGKVEMAMARPLWL
jgi:hypothetical protein